MASPPSSSSLSSSYSWSSPLSSPKRTRSRSPSFDTLHNKRQRLLDEVAAIDLKLRFIAHDEVKHNFTPGSITLVTREKPVAIDLREKPVVIDLREKPDPVDVLDHVCVVCLERPADTLVLPCMCNVVCHVCSPKLKGTINEKRCVMCEKPIVSILMDGQ